MAADAPHSSILSPTCQRRRGQLYQSQKHPSRRKRKPRKNATRMETTLLLRHRPARHRRQPRTTTHAKYRRPRRTRTRKRVVSSSSRSQPRYAHYHPPNEAMPCVDARSYPDRPERMSARCSRRSPKPSRWRQLRRNLRPGPPGDEGAQGERRKGRVSSWTRKRRRRKGDAVESAGPGFKVGEVNTRAS